MGLERVYVLWIRYRDLRLGLVLLTGKVCVVMYNDVKGAAWLSAVRSRLLVTRSQGLEGQGKWRLGDWRDGAQTTLDAASHSLFLRQHH